jgi:bifunctional UDP-N-acetylglucosamine pyrophosphorylase/glucosamine-1-phosphate N-acetyltransferase
MKSDLPKVLHKVKGVPIILRLLKSVAPICNLPSIIVGYKSEEVKIATQNKYNYILQKEQLGTGHAIMTARDALKDWDIETLLVLPGDHPLVSTATIQNLLDNHLKSDAAVSLGTVKIDENDPRLTIFNNFGRIIRDKHGRVERIVEFKDATNEERLVREFNLSYYCFDAKWLWKNIDKLKSNNAANEYYLTDMVYMAKEQNRHVDSYVISEISECLGINNPEQLKIVEDALGE